MADAGAPLSSVFRTAIGETIFRQKYAHEGAETWEQLASLVVEDVCRGFLNRDEKETLIAAIREFKFIPGGRYLRNAGRDLKYFSNCLEGSEQVVTPGGPRRLDSFQEGEVFAALAPSGLFRRAVAHSYGDRPVNQITFGLKRGGGKRRWAVTATPDHRWILVNDDVTTNLRVGDMVASAGADLAEDAAGYAHGIVFADGSFQRTRKRDGAGSYAIRLCGRKALLIAALRSVFETTDRAEYDGDPTLGLWSHTDLKSVPGPEMSPAYRASFIRGWVECDGHASSVLHSIDRLAIDWFVENAPLAGFIPTSDVHVETHPTNYGPRNNPLYYVRFQSASMHAGFKVLSIESAGTKQVFCPEVEEEHAFVLASGMATGNCFALLALEDTREEWASLSQRSESCLISGGGIGVDYSLFRHNGAPLKRTGGTASGPVSKMTMINEIGRRVMQGGARRSAIYASLNWSHPDAKEFLHAKDWHVQRIPGAFTAEGKPFTVADAKLHDFNHHAQLDHTNISLNYDDAWLNDPLRSMHPIFLDNVRQALSTSEPGFSFNFGAQSKFTGRNACVPGETRILTRDGYKPIASLVGQEVAVWNGSNWANVKPFSTGVNALVEVVLSDGSSLRCTPYHRFPVRSAGYRDASWDLVHADALTPGDTLAAFPMPVIEGGTDPAGVHAYSQGFYSADGTTALNYSQLFAPKFVCLNRLQGEFGTVHGSGDSSHRTWKHGLMKGKGYVPSESTIPFRLEWLAGLLDGDGTITRNANSEGVQLGSVDRSFFDGVRLLLTTLGCRPKINKGNPPGMRVMPDGRGGEKEYQCQQLWRLLIGAGDVHRLLRLGLKCSRLDLNLDREPQRDARRFVKVVEVRTLNTTAETFCFTEPETGLGTFEGIVTGQCTEFVTDEDSDVCNLGSINLANVTSLAEMETLSRLGAMFLYCGTITGLAPNAKSGRVRDRNRRIGLGIMGVHEWLIQRGARYEVTPELHSWLTVYRGASRAGADTIADALGLPRSKAIRAIAPTGTIGMMAGTSTGIEPVFAVAYLRRYLKGDGKTWAHQYVIDSAAKDLIARYGVDPNSIESAAELAEDMERRVRFQADVQDYVDMAISSTINLPPWGSDLNNDDTVQKTADLISKYAPRLRGLTCYADASRGGQPLTRISYADAAGREGVEILEHDSCKGGVCGT